MMTMMLMEKFTSQPLKGTENKNAMLKKVKLKVIMIKESYDRKFYLATLERDWEYKVATTPSCFSALQFDRDDDDLDDDNDDEDDDDE